MKTTKIIALLLCVALVTGLMTACQKKVPQTPDGFTQIMENTGLEVRDDTDTNDDDSPLTAELCAISEGYMIEYYAYEDSNDAQNVFHSNYNSFDEEYPTKTLSTRVNTNRYNYFAFTSGGEFVVVARIENTLVGCIADAEYKQEILTHMEALGYK